MTDTTTESTTKSACMILNGYFIASTMFEATATLPDNWVWATAPTVEDGYQYVTLDNGATWHKTKDRGYGKPGYIAPAILTLGQYRDRFTMAERIGIDNAPDNAALTQDVRWAMKTINTDFAMAANIDRANAQTIISTQMLETYGLLNTGRADEILAP
jgi:hypothetical protein